MPKKRRILGAKVKFISLVKAGANQVEGLFKTEGETVTFESSLVKTDVEGEFLSLVFLPEVRDAHDDIVSKGVLKRTAHEALREGPKVDLEHSGEPLPPEKAYVAESWIAAKGDTRFAGLKDRFGREVNPEGAWATVLKIEDPALQQEVLKGTYKAVSMGGVGIFAYEEVEKTATPTPPSQGKSIMDETTLKALFEGLSKSIVEGVTKALGEVTKALAPPQPVAPAPSPTPTPAPAPVQKSEDPFEFKGDPLNLNDVQAHKRKLMGAGIAKKVDWSNPEQVAAYEASLAKHAPAQDKSQDDDQFGLSAFFSNREFGKSEQPGEGELFKGSDIAAIANQRQTNGLVTSAVLAKAQQLGA